MADAIAAELRRLGDLVERLREDFEAFASRGRLSNAERVMLEKLFEAAAPVFGGQVFSTSDVLRWPTLAPIVAGHSASELTWLFGRAEIRTIAGMRVGRVGTDRGGALWQLDCAVTTPASPTAVESGSMVTNNDRGRERDGTGVSNEDGGRGVSRREKRTV